MGGIKQVFAVVVVVVMVVVGLFTSPVHAGVTPFRSRAARETALQEANQINGGGAAGGGAPCPEFCPFDYTPVCGSDGITYTNPCSLSMVNCREQKSLSAAYMGPCDPFLSQSPTTTTPSPAPPPAAGGGDGGGGAGGGSTCLGVCAAFFAPVCGSNGVTYSNACQLDFASCVLGGNITVAKEGTCESTSSDTETPQCPQACPFIFSPVCGSDGTTYDNTCLLEIADCESKAAGGGTIIQVSEGACGGETTAPEPAAPSSTCSQQCTRIFFPVCGSDGKTYDNQCLLEVADCESRATGGGSVIIVAEGSCEATTEAPAAAEPAPEAASCSRQCTRIFLPVCGSDGVTYSNECLLKIADCESRAAGGAGVALALEEACAATAEDSPSIVPVPEAPSCLKQCTRIFLPVCGSDGISHNSQCLLEIADCESRAAGGAGVSLVSEGPCEAATEDSPPEPAAPSSTCSQQCTRIFFPVCGSDGKTYDNQCLLEVADCESRATGGGSVIIVAEGSCEATTEAPAAAEPAPEAASCSRQCTRIFLPVCGSDGVTYSNECLLKIADCESRAAGGAGVSLALEEACAATAEDSPSIVPVPETPSCLKQCTRIFLPVCGSDGISHNSQCLLEIADCESRAAGGAGVSLVSEGPCEAATEDSLPEPAAPSSTCSQLCIRIFSPVCGSDGKTYDNQCLLEVADCESRATGGGSVITVAEGACGVTTEAPTPKPAPEAPSCLRKCTRIFLPVCGSDGVTYNNDCLLQIADCESRAVGGGGVSLASEAACERPDPRPETRIELKDVIVSCRRNCSQVSKPVCGSDGNTYDNECLMEDASCRSRREGGSSVYLQYGGPCDRMFESLGSGCRRKCSDKYVPVCGSDGKTYDNECVMESFNCEKWARKEQGVYIVDDGPCDDDYASKSEIEPSLNIVVASSLSSSSSAQLSVSLDSTLPSLLSSFSSPRDSQASVPAVCLQACTREFKPLCGSDGVTYSNPCALDVGNCKSRARGGASVVRQFDGPCVAALPRGPECEGRCDKMYQPVCGSDGETYNNMCLLEHADCLNLFTSIVAASEGPCAISDGPHVVGPSAGFPPSAFPEDSEEDSNES